MKRERGGEEGGRKKEGGMKREHGGEEGRKEGWMGREVAW